MHLVKVPPIIVLLNLYVCDINVIFYDIQVWNHIDEGSCPGQGIGVRTRLENGLSGFILTKNFSDKPVNVPEERVNVSHDHAVISSVTATTSISRVYNRLGECQTAVETKNGPQSPIASD